MAGYNRVVLVGNLTRDPDYKQLASGQAVCRLSLASNRQYKNRQTGNLVQEVCYVDIDVWGSQAESCKQYLQKGRPVLVEGRLKFDTWEDQTGQTRSKHSVVADRVLFLSSNAETSGTEITKSNSTVTPAKTAQSTVEPELEKEIIDQIEAIKKKNRKKQEEVAAKPKTGGEMPFKDEPPFEDELPF